MHLIPPHDLLLKQVNAKNRIEEVINPAAVQDLFTQYQTLIAQQNQVWKQQLEEICNAHDPDTLSQEISRHTAAGPEFIDELTDELKTITKSLPKSQQAEFNRLWLVFNSQQMRGDYQQKSTELEQEELQLGQMLDSPEHSQLMENFLMRQQMHQSAKEMLDNLETIAQRPPRQRGSNIWTILALLGIGILLFLTW